MTDPIAKFYADKSEAERKAAEALRKAEKEFQELQYRQLRERDTIREKLLCLERALERARNTGD